MRTVRRDVDRALAEVTSGVELADQAGFASSIVVRLLIGRGCILCLLGRYHDALDPTQKAMKFATRLDNRSLRAECASQLALIEGRLGNSSGQIDWVDRLDPIPGD